MWPKKPKTEFKAKGIAYYRHSAEDRQENSIPIQREQIRAFAKEHGIELVGEYEDAGKSGLSTERRDGFNKMMDRAMSDPAFQYIIALDVSRWGRFQDNDLSSYYRAICKQYGKTVIYKSMGFPKEDDPFHYVILGFEQFRAAAYSRELSDKVFKGCIKIAEQGFHAGGMPPYGLRRLLLDERRHPVQELERGQRKSIQNQRVTFTPGVRQEIRVIRRIFTDFVQKSLSLLEIAISLNHDNIASPGNKLWSNDAIQSILTNELYVGTMVYNKTRQKLLSKTQKNPKEQWIRTENAFPPIVDRRIFDQAQAILKKQQDEYDRKYSVADMVSRLETLYQKYGLITAHLISVREDMLSPSAYVNRFHSLGMAFQQMFPDTLSRITQSVVEKLRTAATTVEAVDDYYVLNDSFSILIQPSVPVPLGYEVCWAFRPDPRADVDITLGVLLTHRENSDILGYLAFPRLLVDTHSIRLFGSSEGPLDLFGYSNLSLIESLLS
jgi:DNA invertase Pin-like site-specific DNA recombinase